MGVFSICALTAFAQEAAPAESSAPATETAAPATETAAPATETAAPAAVQITPEMRAFAEKLNAYKAKLMQLRDLKAEYQTAQPQRRDEILDAYRPLVNETESLQKELIPLAISAFNSADGKEPELNRFLIGIFEWLIINKENYELAFQIADTVFPKGIIPDELAYLYAYGAFAAFNIMELDKAKEWYDLAREKNGISKIRQYDPEDTMKISFALEQMMPIYQDLWAKEKEIRASEAADDNLPRVCLHTTKGDIVLELFANEAPQAVGNFLTLVKDGFYTDVPFHRVLPFFMAQGGDPTGTGSGGPGYCIKCECRQPNARMHFRGSISMAHAGTNTGGSQFFLTFVPTGFLNGKHTVFGRVIDGMAVLSELQRIDPEGENLPAPDKIVSAEILRGEPTPFEKLPGR